MGKPEATGFDHDQQAALRVLERSSAVIHLYTFGFHNPGRGWEEFDDAWYLTVEEAQEHAESMQSIYQSQARIWCVKVPLSPEGIVAALRGDVDHQLVLESSKFRVWTEPVPKDSA